MSKIAIKTYRLEEFPPNAKITSQGDQIKRFELICNDFNQIYVKLLEEIHNVYGEIGVSFKLYWKDDENELVVLANDTDFQTAVQSYKQGDILKIYLIASSGQSFQHERRSSNAKKSQTHAGITCNGCNQSIYGLRHKCKNCFNYNLCEDCKKKNIHFSSHVFGIIQSKYGFLTCLDCDKEMTTSHSICKDCPSENMVGIYPVCNECKLKHHNDHACINVNNSDLHKLRQKLLDDLESSINRGEETKVHYGLNCYGCKRDGVSFRSNSFKCEHICLCEDCLIQGAFKHMISLIKLTNEDAEIQRRKTMFFPNMFMNNINMNMGHASDMHRATMDNISRMGNMFNGPRSGNDSGFHGAWAASDNNGTRGGYF